MSELLDELLALPVGPQTPVRGKGDGECTRSLERAGDRLTATLTDTPGSVTEGSAANYLKSEGLDPAEWEVVGFRKSVWDGPNGKEMESCRFTYKRRENENARDHVDIAELAAVLEQASVDGRGVVHGHNRGDDGASAFVVAIGDLQVGKSDGDGTEGILRRAYECLDHARDGLLDYAEKNHGVPHVHIGWLGDHIEGFESQGGANAWRTGLTLTEQLRIIRAVMTYAVRIFAPLCDRLTMAAVPGNHGETKRFAGNGVTRYDDSFDTDCLLAVQEACYMAGEAYDHVEFYVPDKDEMIVLLDVGGTRIAHAHGHKWNVNKHFDWWKGQSFNRDSAMHTADVLLAGHTHHFHMEMDGTRTFLSVPALESESTWFRHQTGTQGCPGIVTFIAEGGFIRDVNIVRGTKYDRE